MKKQVFKVVALLSLSLMLAVVAVSASLDGKIKANIPFAFSVGGKTLPAGAYTVNSQTIRGVLVIRGESSHTAMNVITNDVIARQQPQQTKLVFRRYGDQYFLAQVWTAGMSDGRKIPTSRAERELLKDRAKHLARNVAEPELVSIVAE